MGSCPSLYLMPNVTDAFDEHQRSAKGDDQKERRKATFASPKKHSADHLDPAQIEISSAIHAIEHLVEPVIGLEQSITRPGLFESAQIRKLQIVFADRIPKISHRDIAFFGNAIESVLHQFVHSDAFGKRRRRHANL